MIAAAVALRPRARLEARVDASRAQGDEGHDMLTLVKGEYTKLDVSVSRVHP